MARVTWTQASCCLFNLHANFRSASQSDSVSRMGQEAEKEKFIHFDHLESLARDRLSPDRGHFA